jgi:hypothetical protein
MKNPILRALISLAVCASLTAACQPSSYAPLQSGIEIQLSSQTEDGLPLRPDGLFHVKALDQDQSLSLHVPASPLEPDAALQRLELPPGSYSVTYSPIELAFPRSSLRRRQAVNVVSQNPFVVVVSERKFTTIKLRTRDGSAAERITSADRPSESPLSTSR